MNEPLTGRKAAPPKKGWSFPHYLWGVCLGVGVVIFLFTFHYDAPAPPPTAPVCDFFCRSDVLTWVQRMALYNSSKDFVDMPLLVDPAVAETAFRALLPSPTKAQLQTFVAQYFNATGSDVFDWLPPDFVADPAFLQGVADGNLRAFAKNVTALWRVLGRTEGAGVAVNPARHSLLPLATDAMLVAGGRFRETYYWDSYWIVRGLLVCQMHQTARTVVNNLLGMVDTYGFVPNGARQYYLNRSQPPLLTQMVAALYNATHDTAWLVDYALPLLDAEYEWWMTTTDDSNASGGGGNSGGSGGVGEGTTTTATTTNRRARTGPSGGETPTDNAPLISGSGHAVIVYDPDDPQRSYTLNRYYTSATTPRPESFREDEATAAEAIAAGVNNGRTASDMYADLAAGAETGWDYSSRWLDDRRSLLTIRTRSVVPADLNAIMYKNERTLAWLHSLAATAAAAEGAAAEEGDEEGVSAHSSKASARASAMYTRAAQARLSAMHTLLWDADHNQWGDFNLVNGSLTRVRDVSSNWIPLWAQAYPADTDLDAVVNSFEESGLWQAGGVCTTNVNTGLQWDFPNAWPPVQHMLIEGFDGMGTVRGQALAFQLAQRWISATYVAFQRTGGYMLEKYDCRTLGGSGGGGEYTLQTGFGWTNGVALALLQKYGDRLVAPPMPPPQDP